MRPQQPLPPLLLLPLRCWFAAGVLLMLC